jgi:Uma2 family endonuclease
MSTVLNPPKTAESRVVLHNISWQTYQRLLEERGDCSAPRLTYDRGELEIMSPTAKHEDVNESIKLLVNLTSMELGPILRGLGSTTFAREDIDRGFEPDSCFYVRNESQIRGKERIDLSVDPVPDIVVEIDITSSSVNKRAVFAQFGVPEVWRYHGTKIEILILADGSYISSDVSLVLPVFTAEALTKLVADSLTLARPDWMRGVREWARAQKGSQ